VKVQPAAVGSITVPLASTISFSTVTVWEGGDGGVEDDGLGEGTPLGPDERVDPESEEPDVPSFTLVEPPEDRP